MSRWARTALLAIAWLVLNPMLTAAEAELPAAVSALQADLEKSQQRWRLAQQQGDAARERVSVLVAGSREARSRSAGLLGAWRHRRSLAELKEALDALRPHEAEEVAARAEVFTLLSAVKAELDSALETGMERPAGRSGDWARERAWWPAKRAFDQQLAELGEGLGQPYALRDLPEAAPPRSAQLRQDQRQHLQARQLQLEAWGVSLEADWRLLGRALELGVLSKAASAKDAEDLQRRRLRAKALLRENRLALSKI